ncbi:MAG TPA: helix-hairpin-helix domain-containing protein [Gemmatimonadales bacterium]|jgi:hypothetical protein
MSLATTPARQLPSHVHAAADPLAINRNVAERFQETARILEDQALNPFRVRAYRHAADVIRRLRQPVDRLLADYGLDGLDRLPGIGRGLARAIRDFVLTGRMPVQERLDRAREPLAELRTLPGIGPILARRLREELGIETLEALEAAAFDGRLARLPGVGEKRLGGIRQALAGRFARGGRRRAANAEEPPVSELLDVDREYRDLAASHKLPTIAPKRMNPRHRAWLPLLHTQRGARHYTALFSNTPRAHELGKTHDWVVLYFGDDGELGQHTIVTESSGVLRGQRIVRGRELECVAHYAEHR